MYCEAECGWSRALGQCVTGLSTEQSEIEQRLGDCSDADDDAGDGSRPADTGLGYIAVGVIIAVVVIAAATVIVVCNKRSGATAEVQARAAQHVDNPAYNRGAGRDPDVSEASQGRGAVPPLDDHAHADVAPVAGATGSGGYEPVNTYVLSDPNQPGFYDAKKNGGAVQQLVDDGSYEMPDGHEQPATSFA